MCTGMRIEDCIDVHTDLCMEMCLDMCADMCIDMCIDLYLDMCVLFKPPPGAECRHTYSTIDMCIDMRTYICIGMCVDVCLDMCVDMMLAFSSSGRCVDRSESDGCAVGLHSVSERKHVCKY